MTQSTKQSITTSIPDRRYIDPVPRVSEQHYMTSDIEPGWISQATYQNLPEIFKEAAQELSSRGELVIEGNMPGLGVRGGKNGIKSSGY